MVEIPTTVKNEEVAEGLALATVPYEGEVGFTFPGVFGALATAYFSKYGATREDLMNITIKKPQQRAAQQKSPVSHDNSGYHERPQRKCQRDSAPCGHAYLQGDRGHQQGSGGPQGAENKDGQYLRLRKGIKSFKAISVNGNPYKQPQDERGNWAKGTDIEPYSDQEYLFYVGDVGSYDEYGKKMAKSVGSLLSESGLSIGILGNEEKSDGNDVKALGEKWLFEQIAKENIDTFTRKGVKKIITLDPHAFNIFRKEYPKLEGGNFEIWHYTQILSMLMKENKIPVAEHKVKVAYHDPCYLGRHNGVYEAPREVLKRILGLDLVEMRRNRENAFCCGGGGGNFFTDMLGSGEESPNRIRAREAYDTGAEIIVVACPMCFKMLDDGVKAEGLEERIRIQNVAEIVSDAKPAKG